MKSFGKVTDCIGAATLLATIPYLKACWRNFNYLFLNCLFSRN